MVYVDRLSKIKISSLVIVIFSRFSIS
uniref:Uncharacterized protein n=1 Tax=Arundo donax TaxID=35708 RepID=A0A0A9C4X3_ARUDO